MGGGQVKLNFDDAARRAFETVSREFKGAPDAELEQAALDAALVALKAAGKVDAESMKAAAAAARSEFIDAGFNPRAFEAKFGAAKGIAGTSRFAATAPTTKKIPGDTADARNLAAKLLGAYTPEKADALKEIVYAV